MRGISRYYWQPAANARIKLSGKLIASEISYASQLILKTRSERFCMAFDSELFLRSPCDSIGLRQRRCRIDR